MRESKSVFIDKIDKTHVQRDEMKEFYKLCKEGKAFLGIEEEEIEKLLEDLDNDNVENSNDMVIQMIIDKIREYTDDFKTKKILDNIDIANIDDSSIIGRSYPQYYDNSYYIQIGRDIEKRMMILSDLFAVLFMYNDEEMDTFEKLVLNELMNANIQRFNRNEEFNTEFNIVQIRMILFEKITGKNNFTDNYVAYAREIYEIALAFLVGHEVGHHYYEHTNKINQNGKIQDYKIKEIQADLYGFDFAFDYLKIAYANEENIYGIHQFAALYIPLIVSSYLCNDIFTDDESHPSVIRRLCIVKKELGKMIDKEAFKEVENYICELLKKIDFDSKLKINKI